LERTEQLNMLVELYQQGNENVIDEICKVVLPIIEHYSEQIWLKVNNYAEFDCRCLMKIKKAAKKFDPSKGNFINLVYSIVAKEKSDFIKRRSKNDEVSLEYLQGYDDGVVREHFPDTKRLEDNFFELFHTPTKETEELSRIEKVALFASQGDQRREVVFKAWTIGYNDSNIATLLQQRFGLTFESQRKFVSRFKKDCRKFANSACE